MKIALIAVSFSSLFISLSPDVMAQQQLPVEKKVFVDTAGRYFQQASLPVYLLVSTTPDGKGIPIKSVKQKEIILEGNGVHTFKHENVATGQDDEIKIYADGLAPVTTSTFISSPEYHSNGKQYYGAGLEVDLKSKDEMSGVEETYHSVNGEPFHSYSVPSFAKEGDYVYTYYAVDRTGNASEVKSATFNVDLTPPSTFHNFVGISSANVR